MMMALIFAIEIEGVIADLFSRRLASLFDESIKSLICLLCIISKMPFSCRISHTMLEGAAGYEMSAISAAEEA